MSMANDTPFAEARRSHKRTHDDMESRRSSSYSNSVRNSPPSYRPQRTQTDPSGSGLQFPRPITRRPDYFSPYTVPVERSRSQNSSRPDITQRRYVGDGLDHRRPIGAAPAASQSTNVIDLTSDTENSPEIGRGGGPSAPRISERRAAGLPRFPNEIIVVTDEAAASAPSRSNNAGDRHNGGGTNGATADSSLQTPSSPEIQFISSRTISAPFNPLVVREEDLNYVNDDVEDDDPIEILSVRRLNPPRTRRVVLPRSITGHDHPGRPNRYHFHPPRNAGAPFGRIFNHLNRLVDWTQTGRRNEYNDDEDGFNNFPPFEPQELNVDINMDYGTVGFDLPARNQDRDDTPATYEPPPAAPEGFTRTPAEEDMLVCPNCGEELCAGDSDLKKQVWIVRGCGHVYCGSCTANRSKSKRKGKMPAQTFSDPFNKCVVEGCGRSCAGRNSMIQLFL